MLPFFIVYDKNRNAFSHLDIGHSLLNIGFHFLSAAFNPSLPGMSTRDCAHW